jgi:hypothetical protein
MCNKILINLLKNFFPSKNSKIHHPIYKPSLMSTVHVIYFSYIYVNISFYNAFLSSSSMHFPFPAYAVCLAYLKVLHLNGVILLLEGYKF